MTDSGLIRASCVDAPIQETDFENDRWRECQPVTIARYWSGSPAPIERHAEVRLCWSSQALHVRFVCAQHEPLVVSAHPQTSQKTLGLWDRDVCEIFLAPDPESPARYFEFEAAPTGEWVDLGILITPSGKQTDWDFISEMAAAAKVNQTQVIIGMKIPWSTSLPKPNPGDRWRLNLFRCVGAESPNRYLAWRPTKTPEPNFHVPEAFGLLHFE